MLAIGTGRLAPGPRSTPMLLMPAAETPDAGHTTVPIGVWRGVTGIGRGWDVSTSTTAMPPAQTSTASSAGIPQRAWLRFGWRPCCRPGHWLAGPGRLPVRVHAGLSAGRGLVGCIPATMRRRYRRYVRLLSQPCHRHRARVLVPQRWTAGVIAPAVGR